MLHAFMEGKYFLRGRIVIETIAIHKIFESSSSFQVK